MGLTIHYALKAGDILAKNAAGLMGELRAAALRLSFDKVSEILSFSKPTPESEAPDKDSWVLLSRASCPILRELEDGSTTADFADPLKLVGFVVYPAEGAEPACFGLGRYPATAGAGRPTNLHGWCWSSASKTQYASNPELGGDGQFLRCHLGIVSLLDEAKQLGILSSVTDDSGYWQKRDEAALIAELRRWNGMVAGFVGRVTDALEDAGMDRSKLASEITKFPNYEHLEAKARDEQQ